MPTDTSAAYQKKKVDTGKRRRRILSDSAPEDRDSRRLSSFISNPQDTQPDL